MYLVCGNTDFFMPKTKEQKQKILQTLAKNIEKQTAMVFVDFKGMNVKNITAFRKELKENNAELFVAKKTLLQKALKEQKIDADIREMEGQIGIVFAYDDPTLAIKSAGKKLEIVGGYFEKQLQEKEPMKAIANLPSKEELWGRLVGSIASPLSGFVSVLQGNIKDLVYILANIKK